MKKTAILFLCCLLYLLPLTANASTEVLYEREELDNGYYIETILEEKLAPSVAATTSTKTGKKTATCKDSNGNAVWSITVHGSFSYDGTTAKCTAVSMSKSVTGSNWTLSDLSCSKSGASCKASATGKLKASGVVIQTINKTVTLKCSAKGVLS